MRVLKSVQKKFHETLAKYGKSCIYLQGQIDVRGREQIVFKAIFKLDLSDPHTRT